MANTTNGLPYPVGTDRVMDGDNAIQALAQAIDPGWVDCTATVVPQAGWTVQSAKYIKSGPFVWFVMQCTRTGADIVVSSGGNVTPDVDVITALPAAIRPTTLSQQITFRRSAVQTAWGTVSSAGVMSLTDGLPSVTLTGTNTVYFVVGQWPLGI